HSRRSACVFRSTATRHRFPASARSPSPRLTLTASSPAPEPNKNERAAYRPPQWPRGGPCRARRPRPIELHLRRELAPGAYPLSLSMPLAAAKHGHKPMEAFLWGLLPDNTAILDRWARRFQVSARNPFALMSHVGEDCAGAVQFVRPERLNDVVGQGPSEIDW